MTFPGKVADVRRALALLRALRLRLETVGREFSTVEEALNAARSSARPRARPAVRRAAPRPSGRGAGARGRARLSGRDRAPAWDEAV